MEIIDRVDTVIRTGDINVNNKTIGIVSNNGHSPWLKHLAEILGTLGEPKTCNEAELEENPAEHCDLILVDASGLQMGLSGRISWLHGRFPDVPIVVLTSSPTWRRARAVLHAGASDYMSRSIEDAMLLARCRSILQRPP